MSRPPVTSLMESAYKALRDWLLNGTLRPGTKLKISDLCEQLSANGSAVREALARLTSEGLVVWEPQRGFRVAPITRDDLHHLTEARIPIEELCIRRAIEKGDILWETTIAAALHAVLRTPRVEADGTASRTWAEANNAFHRTLVAACDNPWLLKMRESLAMQGERYRWFSVAAAGPGRDLDREHRELADACLDRDADRAVALMREHLTQTTVVLLRHGLASDPCSTPPGVAG